MSFAKGGIVKKEELTYALVWFYDQWMVMPFYDEKPSTYSVELKKEDARWVACNLATSVCDLSDEDIKASEEAAFTEAELAKMFSVFRYAATGVADENCEIVVPSWELTAGQRRDAYASSSMQDMLVLHSRSDWDGHLYKF